MCKKKVIKITVIIIVCAVAFGIATLFGILIHFANTFEFEMLSNTHFTYIVKVGQVVDYHCFINPQGDTKALEHIDKSIRLQIAEYMRSNNYKLKEGMHYIRKRNGHNGNEDIGTLEEHLKYFKFESIE